jgi:hypothetical protein
VSEESPQHEQRDLRLAALVKIGAGLLVCLVVVGAIAALVLRVVKKPSAPVDSGPQNVATVRSRPPGPQLQIDPSDELRRLHDDENLLLTRYGWIDKPRGRVRIPIDRAMAVIAARGLPHRTSHEK